MTSVKQTGFTLLEMLVGVTIIGLMIGLILNAVSVVRAAAAKTNCQNSLRQIGIALHQYHDVNNELPSTIEKPINPNDPKVVLGWMVHILPYVEQEALWREAVDACKITPNYKSNPPHTTMAKVVKTYVCPADDRWNMPKTNLGVTSSYTTYIGIASTIKPGQTKGQEGMFSFFGTNAFRKTTDGLSQTILVSERPPPNTMQAGWWYPDYLGTTECPGPNNTIILHNVSISRDECQALTSGIALAPGRTDNSCDRFHLWSLHKGGANFLFGDGSVKFFDYSANRLIFDLGSRSGGEVVDIP